MQFSSGLSIGGATLAGFDLPTAQKLMNKEGQLDEIAIAAKPDATEQQLIDEVEEILPPATQVQTGAEQAASDAADTNEFITFLQGFLLAFGGIALFVGSFVIANSLSITIAQRTRELATLADARRVQTPGARLDHRRGARRRNRRLARRALPRAAARQGALPAVRRRRLHAPEHGARLRDAHGRGGAARGDPRDAPREPASRNPGDARSADRRRPRGRDAAAGPLCPLPLDRRRADDGRRVRGASLRALRERPRHHAGPHLDGRRRTAHLPRGRALLVPARASARPRPRGARGRVRRSRGHPCPRQRAEEPTAHRLDRGRTDDRARARHARRDARGGDRRPRSRAR